MDGAGRLLIFNIQKYSLHDGSGIRTVVFLKGCPLRCRWCCNPESQHGFPELMYRRSRCLGRDKCGLCKRITPSGAVSFDTDGMACIDRSKLGSDWEEWVSECPTDALAIEGRYVSTDEVIEHVLRDEVFYRHGDGGLTVSGGEPLMQADTVTLLRTAKENHINTYMETCGHVDTDRLLTTAEYLDGIYYDIKSVDDKKHMEYTGVSNARIMDNLRRLRVEYPDKKIKARTPVIPGFNDTDAELAAIERFVNSIPRLEWERLPYHTYGAGKYEMLGRRYEMM